MSISAAIQTDTTHFLDFRFWPYKRPAVRAGDNCFIRNSSVSTRHELPPIRRGSPHCRRPIEDKACTECATPSGSHSPIPDDGWHRTSGRSQDRRDTPTHDTNGVDLLVLRNTNSSAAQSARQMPPRVLRPLCPAAPTWHNTPDQPKLEESLR